MTGTPTREDGEIGGGESSDGPVQLASEAKFRLGSLAIDPPLRMITGADGSEHLIEPRMMQVLVVLATARGAVVDRPTINRRCWNGRAVSDDALDRVIAKLRRQARIWGDERVAIETVPRIGFRITPVANGSADEPLPPTGRAATPGLWSRRGLALGAGAVALAATAGVSLSLRRPSRSAAAAPAAGGMVKVAVLPFDNLSADPALAFLAAGVARQMRDQLSRVAGLRMVAEASSASVTADLRGARERGDRLGAAYLVEGSVREAGKHVRITASLIETASGAVLWIDQRDGDAAELFALQDALAGALLRELAGRAGVLAPAQQPARPIDGIVFRMLLEGEDWFEQCRAARMEGKAERAFDCADRSIGLAREALARDPHNPAALLLLARLTRYGWPRLLARQPLSPEQRAAHSLVFITRALSTDPNDPAALTALGDYYRHYEWRWREAETLFRKALAINPSYIEAHWSYGYQLGTTGRALEGLHHAATVYALDPDTTWRRVALPRLLYLVGDRAGAAHHYGVELTATPANVFLIMELYIIALSEGDAAALDRLAARVRSLSPGARSARLEQMLTRITHAATALRGAPAALIASVDADVTAYDRDNAGSFAGEARADSDLLYIYAIEYAWSGADDAAIAMFKRAFAARSLYWPATLPCGIAPLPARLRADPHYRAIWTEDTALQTLLAMRRRALGAQQMAGIADDGRMIRPASGEIAAAFRPA